MNSVLYKIASALVVLTLTGTCARVQAMPAAETPDAKGTFLLTIFLKHDQSKPLEQINAQLRQQGFYKAFPPDGVAVDRLARVV